MAVLGGQAAAATPLRFDAATVLASMIYPPWSGLVEASDRNPQPGSPRRPRVAPWRRVREGPLADPGRELLVEHADRVRRAIMVTNGVNLGETGSSWSAGLPSASASSGATAAASAARSRANWLAHIV